MDRRPLPQRHRRTAAGRQHGARRRRAADQLLGREPPSGRGPSSSHTMGPMRAARIFLSEHRDASSFRVTLYG
ncbi:MAG: serine dehydratase beta chain, partial [Bradyrhizobium sp.]